MKKNVFIKTLAQAEYAYFGYAVFKLFSGNKAKAAEALGVSLSTLNQKLEQKTCSKCKVIKPLTEFYKQTTTADKLKSQCRRCHFGYTQARQKLVRQNKKIQKLQVLSIDESAAD